MTTALRNEWRLSYSRRFMSVFLRKNVFTETQFHRIREFEASRTAYGAQRQCYTGDNHHRDVNAAERAHLPCSRMIVDRLDLAADDPQYERQEAQLRDQSRFAQTLVVEDLKQFLREIRDVAGV